AFLDQVKDGTRLPPSISVYVPPKETSATGDKTATGEALEMKSDGSALVSFNTSGLASAKRKGNDYLYDNFQIDDTYWGYYYLYALERYAFFRERAEGSVRQIPDWYDQGVEYLQTRQMKNGAFPKIRFESQYIATCFASLFLVRSSEVLVLPGNKGGLSGGESLRSNVRLDLVNGKIKTFDVIKGMDDVMQLLDGDEIDEKQYELILDSLTRSVNNLSGNTRRSPREQLAYLRGLVSDRNYFKRRIAVKLLSRQQEMDNVPALIYALGDPDLRICQEAHNGLRLISRKLDSIPITDEPTYAEYQNIKKQWTEWFLKIRPGAELLD
ncbi:MAG: HEAT repeat domain-containing protein, partial [Planctomycetota bacterium]